MWRPRPARCSTRRPSRRLRCAPRPCCTVRAAKEARLAVIAGFRIDLHRFAAAAGDWYNSDASACRLPDRCHRGVVRRTTIRHSSTLPEHRSTMRRTVLATCLLAIAAMPAPTAGADDSIEGKFLSNVRQLTSGFVKAGEGYFSPDGKTIVYQAVPQGYPFYQIYKQPLAGGEPQLLSTGRGRTTCSYFSPDGKRISVRFEPSRSEALGDRREGAQAAGRRRHAPGRRRRYSVGLRSLHGYLRRRSRRQASQAAHRHAKGYDAEGPIRPTAS